MGRPKKTSTPKVKQLVRLRFKKCRNGEQSIYLDLYQDGQRAYEFLKDENNKALRLLPEIGTPDEIKAIKARNHQVMLRAEAIRIEREKGVIELGKVEKKLTSLGKMLLKDWLVQYVGLISVSVGIARQKQVNNLEFHLKNWLGSKYDTIQMQQLTTELFRDFLKHLRNYKRKSKMKDEVYTLSENSIYEVFSSLKSCMGRAFREGIITKNPIEGMKDNGELPKHPTVQRVFLTAPEVKALIKTECRREDIKRAFLFACFCGLRISDIYKLKWSEIIHDGEDLRLELTMQKTKDPVSMKLNEQALIWLPERDDATPSDKVFPNLPTPLNIGKVLTKWGNDAGIQKRFTFHSARHSFGTLMINNGVDIYTVSKLLGHRSLQTTRIYAELVNKAKDDAVDTLSGIFKG
ncbi:MAG: tyrosine-type recombinase/integrase [Bacteroidales bacterium]|nr:tyrosine-type recombinase/integrase [Bacteroidales bacterium]